MKTIIIMGGGSGVGRVTAQRFLQADWRVGLIGRREGALAETAGGHDVALVLPCNVTDDAASADVPRPGSVPYTTSKYAVTGLTRTLSLDGCPFDIAVGQIDIGNALTDMAEAMTKGVPQADGSVKVEPVIDAKTMADSVLHMASVPDGANVQWLTVMATNMPYIGRG